MYKPHHSKVSPFQSCTISKASGHRWDLTPGFQAGESYAKTNVCVWYPSYLESQWHAVLCRFYCCHIHMNKLISLSQISQKTVWGLTDYSHQQGFILIGSKHRTPGSIHQDCVIFHPILKSSVCKLCSTGSYKDNLHILTQGLHVFHGILFPKDNRRSFKAFSKSRKIIYSLSFSNTKQESNQEKTVPICFSR